jgi:protoporphyrinogen/coproporphyrinogen III oxidase
VQHIGIIGAGVAGLTVAYRRQQMGDRVSLLEASPRVGGQLHSERAFGFVVEHGAEGFVAGSQAVAGLAHSLGIAGHILDQQVTVSCTFDGERLQELGPGEAGRRLGFQVAERAFGKGIQSFSAGMLELAEVLHARLGPNASSSLGTKVRALEPRAERWAIWPVDGEPLEVDEVVVATSAAAAAAILEPTFGAAARALASSNAVSSVTVSVAYPHAAVGHPLDATGFVVADEAQTEGFRACTFTSSKLHGRAPSGHVLLRAFFRPTLTELAALDDAAWTERATRSIARAIELRGAPDHSWVSRWPNALPVFDAAHRGRVAVLEQHLQGSGVVLAGASFHGSGIDGAVRSAEAAVNTLGSRAAIR